MIGCACLNVLIFVFWRTGQLIRLPGHWYNGLGTGRGPLETAVHPNGLFHIDTRGSGSWSGTGRLFVMRYTLESALRHMHVDIIRDNII